MAGKSASEAIIRAAVSDRLRVLLPGARIIHEMNVDQGSNRVDIAAVTSSVIYLIEIKSEKDKLTRCKDQLAAYRECGHHTIVVGHAKWFERKVIRNDVWLSEPDCFRKADATWIYPESAGAEARRDFKWELPKISLEQPPARRLLKLLWQAELYEACKTLGVVMRRKATPIDDLITLIAWNCTGEQICRAACAALRSRTFAEADEPIRAVATAERVVEPVQETLV